MKVVALETRYDASSRKRRLPVKWMSSALQMNVNYVMNVPFYPTWKADGDGNEVQLTT